jgi:hypothetical protein
LPLGRGVEKIVAVDRHRRTVIFETRTGTVRAGRQGPRFATSSGTGPSGRRPAAGSSGPATTTSPASTSRP